MTRPPHTISWLAYVNEVARCSALLEVTLSGTAITPAQGFEALLQMLLCARQAGNIVYFAGNGASAAMSSHTAADLAKNGRLRTQVFTDPACLTCIANDLAFDRVFADALELYAKPGDVFVGISSSGMSPNMLAVAQSARRLGLESVTLTAFSPQNTLRGLGTLNFYIPTATYGLAESCHAALLHYGVERLINTPLDTGN